MASTFANLRSIFKSDLEPSLKPLAIALALHGDEAAQVLYPSVRTLAAWLGRDRRTVQRGLRALEQLAVIRPLTTGGYGSADRNPRGGTTTVYAFQFDHLPEGRHQRRPSRVTTDTQRATPATPLATGKGGNCNTKGRQMKHVKGGTGDARSTLDRLRSTLRKDNPPVPPFSGGRRLNANTTTPISQRKPSKREWESAMKTRELWGECRHEPTCTTNKKCLGRIVMADRASVVQGMQQELAAQVGGHKGKVSHGG